MRLLELELNAAADRGNRPKRSARPARRNNLQYISYQRWCKSAFYVAFQSGSLAQKSLDGVRRQITVQEARLSTGLASRFRRSPWQCDGKFRRAAPVPPLDSSHSPWALPANLCSEVSLLPSDPAPPTRSHPFPFPHSVGGPPAAAITASSSLIRFASICSPAASLPSPL